MERRPGTLGRFRSAGSGSTPRQCFPGYRDVRCPTAASRGIDAYKKTWDLFLSWSRDSWVFDIIEIDIAAGIDVAFVTARMRCAGTGANGDRSELEFPLTIGLRKIAGQWIIMHEHHSIPAQ